MKLRNEPEPTDVICRELAPGRQSAAGARSTMPHSLMKLMNHSPPSCTRLINLLSGGAALALAGGAWAQALSGPHSATAAAADRPETVVAAPSDSTAAAVPTVTVTASRPDLVGVAATSSEGKVNRHELELRPVYRVGQLLETVPGLVATAHSGEGKANQYLLRGFNLDHGTDLATYVDEMPVNARTHAHGQGYTDLNFVIPELVSGLEFTKGPYHAADGDFASAGSTRLSYGDRIANAISVMSGSVGDRRGYAGASTDLAGGTLLGAAEVVRFDGPWEHGDGVRKFNGVLRYSEGGTVDGYAVTGMFYRNRWNATTDQPLRAVQQGAIGRFGTLDDSDGGKSERYSLSLRYGHSWHDTQFKASAYAIRSTLTLWNDFTHLLDDPVNGDQHGQNDARTIVGGAVSLTMAGRIFGAPTSTVIGAQSRNDSIDVNLQHTVRRVVLDTERDNHVRENSAGIHAENTTVWAPWLRSVVGVRADYFRSNDSDRLIAANSGVQSKTLLQPKVSLAFSPFEKTEFYVSAGTGFHSNDARSGLNDSGTAYVRPPLLVKSRGSEIGVRTNYLQNLQFSATLFHVSFDSELVYNGDAGTTEAGRPSRRRGIELTGQFRPVPWLALNANIAVTRARFSDHDAAGDYIEEAPDFIASAGILVDNLGSWFGALALRELGPHPLNNDNSVRSTGYAEWNGSIGYKLSPTLKLRLDVFNLRNATTNAADYYYVSRLAGERAEGVMDRHAHPLEPRSARITLSKTF